MAGSVVTVVISEAVSIEIVVVVVVVMVEFACMPMIN